MADTTDIWAAFLNPEVVRPKLIAAGLFLLGHEMLIDSIKRHPLEFFANRWTADGPEPSEKYRTEVLALDPKGKGDPLRGSIAWLRQEDVITADDEATIRTATDARNKIAHEMMTLFHNTMPPGFVEHFPALLSLTQKIEKWWIVNVELATNPDYDGAEIDEDGIISGPSWIMQLLTQVALGDDEEAWEFHRRFMEMREQGRSN
jgi:hypothetical protein